ncbi:MAG: hypothetical protein ACOCRL_00420 [Bacillota bacterium]
MSEEKNQELEVNLQMFRPHESFQRRLDENFQDQLVVVEFCCGQFLKKAMGVLTLIGKDFIELTAFSNDIVTIDIYGPKGIVETEEAASIIIPIERVAGVELICPPCPPCPPCPSKRSGKPDRSFDADKDEE